MKVFNKIFYNVVLLIFSAVPQVLSAQCDGYSYKIDVQKTTSFDLSKLGYYESVCFFSSKPMTDQISFELLNTINDSYIEMHIDESINGLVIPKLDLSYTYGFSIYNYGKIAFGEVIIGGAYNSGINNYYENGSLTIDKISSIDSYGDQNYLNAYYGAKVFIKSDANFSSVSNIYVSSNSTFTVDGSLSLGEFNGDTNYLSANSGSKVIVKSLNINSTYLTFEDSDLILTSGDLVFKDAYSSFSLDASKLNIAGNLVFTDNYYFSLYEFSKIEVKDIIETSPSSTGYMFNYQTPSQGTSCATIRANSATLTSQIGNSKDLKLCAWNIPIESKFSGEVTVISGACQECVKPAELFYDYYYTNVGDTLELNGLNFPSDFKSIKLVVESTETDNNPLVIQPFESNGSDKIKIIVPKLGMYESIKIISGDNSYAYINLNSPEIDSVGVKQILKDDKFWVYGKNLKFIGEAYAAQNRNSGEGQYFPLIVLDSASSDSLLIQSTIDFDCRTEIGVGRPYTLSSSFYPEYDIYNWFGGMLASVKTVKIAIGDASITGSFENVINNACPYDTIRFETIIGDTIYYDHASINNENRGLKIIGNGVDKTILKDLNIDTYYSGLDINSADKILIKDLTFTNSICTNNGGAIALSNETYLTIDNVHFFNNQSRYDGGAISIESDPQGFYYPELHIKNGSKFTKNVSDYSGGAINIGGLAEVVISDAIFKDNYIKAIEGGSGSAINYYLYSYDYPQIVLDIDNSSFENNGNLGDGEGGAISLYNDYGTSEGGNNPGVSITNSSFLFNKSNLGGAIYNYDFLLNIAHSTFEGNESMNDGGAIYNSYTELNIDSCTVQSNSSVSGNGGAICLIGNGEYSPEVTINHSIFKSNENLNLNADGGAIYCEVNLNTDSTSFYDNRAQNGGAIWFNNSSGGEGGSIYANLYNGHYSNNYADSLGGAIGLVGYYDEYFFQNLVMNANIAAKGNGGALFLNSDYGNVYLNESSLIKNASKIGNGGAVYSLNTQLYLDSTIVSGNNAELNGGGICMESDYSNIYFSLDKSIFEKNVALGDGGGLYVNSQNLSGNVYLDKSTFADNSAINGGAIWNNIYLDLNYLSIFNNNASSYGGGLYLTEGNSSYIYNTTIARNTANYGGAMYLASYLYSGSNAIGENQTVTGVSEIEIDGSLGTFNSNGNNVFTSKNNLTSISSSDIVLDDLLFLERNFSTTGNQKYLKPLCFSPLVNRKKVSGQIITEDLLYRPTVEFGQLEIRQNNVLDQIGNNIFGDLQDVGAIELQESGDPLYVTQSSDSLVCGSLRGASLWFKYHAVSDTITFSPSLAGKRINLNKTINFEIFRTSEIIQEAGSPQFRPYLNGESRSFDAEITLDGSGVNPIIGIDPSMTSGFDLLIADTTMTIKNITVNGILGDGTKNSDNGIKIQSENVLIDSVVFNYNGVGVTVDSDYSTITNSRFFNNKEIGILLKSNYHEIFGNTIGLNKNGQVPTDLQNHTLGGLVLSNSSYNTIGGKSLDKQNVIAGNRNIGIAIGGSENTIVGNRIGITKDDVPATNKIGIDFLNVESNPTTLNVIGNDSAFNIIAYNEIGINMPSAYQSTKINDISKNTWALNQFIANDTVTKIVSSTNFQGGVNGVYDLSERDSVITGYNEFQSTVYVYLDNGDNAAFFVDSVKSTGYSFELDLKTKTNLPKFKNFTVLQNYLGNSSPLSLGRPLGCQEYKDSLRLDSLYSFCTTMDSIGIGEVILPFQDSIRSVQWYIRGEGFMLLSEETNDTLEVTGNFNDRYFAEVTLNNGCILNTDTFDVEFPIIPEVQFLSDPICLDSGSYMNLNVMVTDSVFFNYSLNGNVYKDTLSSFDKIWTSKDSLIDRQNLVIDTAFGTKCMAQFSFDTIQLDINPILTNILSSDTQCEEIFDITTAYTVFNADTITYAIQSEGNIDLFDKSVNLTLDNSFVAIATSDLGCESLDYFQVYLSEFYTTLNEDSLVICDDNDLYLGDYAYTEGDQIEWKSNVFTFSDSSTTDTYINDGFGEDSIQLIISNNYGCSKIDTLYLKRTAPVSFKDSTVMDCGDGVVIDSSFAYNTKNSYYSFYIDGEMDVYIGDTVYSSDFVDVFLEDTTTACSSNYSLSIKDGSYTVTSTFTNPTCFEGNDGSIEFTLTGDTLLPTITWSVAGLVGDTITNLSSGTYEVFISSNGCLDTLTTILMDPAPFDYTLNSRNVSITDLSDQSALVGLLSFGGTTYIHTWSSDIFNIENTLAIDPKITNGTGIGYLYLEVKDPQLGCIEFDTIMVSVLTNPVAVNDTITVIEDSNFVIRPLLNDVDLNGSTGLSLSVLMNASNGNSIVIGTDSILYIPSLNFNGLDTIQYTTIDGFGKTDVAYIYIEVLSVNDLPIASLDSNSISEDEVSVSEVEGSGKLLNNDTDVDLGDVLSVVTINQSANQTTIGKYGTLVWKSDGTYVYNLSSSATDTLAEGEEVEDVLEYVVSDVLGGLDTMDLVILITGKSDTPNKLSSLVTPINVSGFGVTVTTENVLDKFEDIDGDVLTIQNISTTLTGSTVVFNSISGAIEYTSPASLGGLVSIQDTVIFSVCDNYSLCLVDTIIFNVTDKLKIEYQNIPQKICLGDDLNIVSKVLNGNFIQSDYSWSYTLDGVTETDLDSILNITPQTSGSLEVTLIAKNGVLSNDTAFTIEVLNPLDLESFNLTIKAREKGLFVDENFVPGLSIFTCDTFIDYTFIDTDKFIMWDTQTIDSSDYYGFTIGDMDETCMIRDSVYIRVNTLYDRQLPISAETGNNVSSSSNVLVNDFGEIQSVSIVSNPSSGSATIGHASDTLNFTYVSTIETEERDSLLISLTDYCGITQNVELKVKIKNTVPQPIDSDSVEITISIGGNNIPVTLLAFDVNKNQTRVQILDSAKYAFIRFGRSTGTGDNIVVPIQLIEDFMPESFTQDTVHYFYIVYDKFGNSETFKLIINITREESAIDLLGDIVDAQEYSTKEIRDSLQIVLKNNAISNQAGLKFEFLWNGKRINNSDSLSYDITIMSRWGDVVYYNQDYGTTIEWYGDYLPNKGDVPSGEKVEDGNYFWVLSIQYINKKGNTLKEFATGYLFYVNRDIDNSFFTD